MSVIKYVASLLIAGFLVMCGLRAAEWLIPQPETRVILCLDDERYGSLCASLDEVKDNIAAIQSAQENAP